MVDATDFWTHVSHDLRASEVWPARFRTSFSTAGRAASWPWAWEGPGDRLHALLSTVPAGYGRGVW